MRTSVMLTILAVGAIVAFASLAAAGPSTGIPVTQGQDNSGQGTMSRNGGCHEDGGQLAQYRHGGECPWDYQAELRNSYSWSYGEGNMTCGGTANQTEFQNHGEQCPGTCDGCYNWNYTWNWDCNHCSQ